MQDNDIEMYSTQNEGKFERAKLINIRLQYQKICVNKLKDIVDKYNNTCNRTIKMNPIDDKYIYRI